jgi:hypothetical protein
LQNKQACCNFSELQQLRSLENSSFDFRVTGASRPVGSNKFASSCNILLFVDSTHRFFDIFNNPEVFIKRKSCAGDQAILSICALDSENSFGFFEPSVSSSEN